MEESKSKIKAIDNIKNYIPRNWIGIYIIWITLHFILFLLAGANNHFDSDFWPINEIRPKFAYDYTELLIYSIVPILIFLAFYFLRNDNKNLKTDDGQERNQDNSIEQNKEEIISYTDNKKAETNEYENQDFNDNTSSKNQNNLVTKEKKNINTDIKRVENTSNIYVYLWLFYPFLMLLLAYIKLSLSWGDTYIHPAIKIAEVVGTATGIFIIPLIIVGIRKIFTKKKLSSLSYVIFFYVVSLLSFYFSTFETLLESSH